MRVSAVPTRGKDHRHEKAALPPVWGSRAAADPPTPLGTTARAGRDLCLPIPVVRVSLSVAATGGYDLAERLSPCTENMGHARPPSWDPGHAGVCMQPPCPHCDQPDMSLLRLVLIGEILRAEEPGLVWLADVMQQSGLWHLAEEPRTPHRQPRPGTLHVLRHEDV